MTVSISPDFSKKVKLLNTFDTFLFYMMIHIDINTL